MKAFFCSLCLIVLSVVISHAQSNPPAQSKSTPQPTPNQAQIFMNEMRRNQQRNEEYERLKRAGNPAIRSEIFMPPYPIGSVKDVVGSLYRKTNANELRLLAPDKKDAARFANFLRQRDTGLIKIVPDKGCAPNERVIVVTADCLGYTMPGAGNSYSFRVKDYRVALLADVTFTDGGFQATGFLLNGIFVKLGDVPLEQVNLQTDGMKFLLDFKPGKDFQKVKEIDRQLAVGIKADGFLYRRTVKAKDNTTYLLRSIAYRGKSVQGTRDLGYAGFASDKRSDVVVAFRVVRRDAVAEDGAVTILWRQWAKKDSPKIK